MLGTKKSILASFYLFFTHAFSQISNLIHFSPVITILKNNIKVSFIFSMAYIKYFTNSLSSILTHIYIFFWVIFNNFNYIILKCYNNLLLETC